MISTLHKIGSSSSVLLSYLVLSLVLFYSSVVADSYSSECTHHSAPAEFNLTSSQIENYERNGYIIVKGLLQGKELKKAIQAVNKIQRWQPIGQRIFYKFLPAYRNTSFQTWRNHKALEYIAFDSAASTISAKLMGLEVEARQLRLLKDAVLGYHAGDQGCGWHVDDKVFWPCQEKVQQKV